MESKTEFDAHEVWVAFKDSIWALLVPGDCSGRNLQRRIYTNGGWRGGVRVWTLCWLFHLPGAVLEGPEKDFDGHGCQYLSGAADYRLRRAFTWVLTIQGIATAIGGWFAAVSSGKIIFMALTILLLLFMGCFMECCASVLMVVPILLPVAQSLGIDPVYFGVIVVMTLSLGMATPPVGEDLYIAASIAGIKFEQEVKYVMPLVGAAILAIAICAALPGLVMFLPNLFYG